MILHSIPHLVDISSLEDNDVELSVAYNLVADGCKQSKTFRRNPEKSSSS